MIGLFFLLWYNLYIMPIKRFFQELNFIDQCKKNNLTLWQCPSFLFLITSLVTILAMLSTYIITIKYTQPEIVALIVIGVTAVLFIINYLIVQGKRKTSSNKSDENRICQYCFSSITNSLNRH